MRLFNRILTPAILLSFSCVTVLCFVSSNLQPRFANRQEAIDGQFRTLRGERFDYPMSQNRIIFPLLLKTCSSMKMFSVGEWFLILSFLIVFFAFLVFYLLLVSVGRANLVISTLAMLMLTYSMIPAFNSGWEYPVDYFEMLFFSVFLLLALRKKYILFLLSAILAAANRESSVFSGLIWLFLYGIDQRGRLCLRGSVFATATGLISYAFVFVLLYIFTGGKISICSMQSVTSFRYLWFTIKRDLMHYLHN